MLTASFMSDELTFRAIILLNDYKACTFELTGSRLFTPSAAANLNSDWDFFAQHSTELEHYLKTSGFTSRSKPEYAGLCDVKAVYSLGHVDVQLVGNVKTKNAVQQALLLSGALTGQPKAERKLTWRLAYSLIDKLTVNK